MPLTAVSLCSSLAAFSPPGVGSCMAQASSRAGFNRSGLVRLLSGLDGGDVPEAKQSFAERLGQWLDFTDALPLYSALNTAAPARSAGDSPRDAATVRASCEQVRAALTEMVSAEGKGRVRWPVFAVDADRRADFSPYLRYYLAQQREMATRISALRAAVRADLALHAGEPGRLAALDAVLEKAFATRERTLLATVPSVLGRRFEHLCQVHGIGAGERADGEASEPVWLSGFRGEVRAALVAELEVRMQPVEGMADALDRIAGA